MENKKASIFTWKIGGQAGGGQQASGLTFAKSCTRAGYYAFGYSEFPSVIRGGHVTASVSVSRQPITAAYQTIQLLVALNKETIQRHIQYLGAQGMIIYDSSVITQEDLDFALQGGQRKKRKFFLSELPLAKLIKENNLLPIMGNMIAVGASFGVLNFDFSIFRNAIQEIFKRKGKSTVDMNTKAAEIGYRYSHEHFRPYHYPYSLKVSKQVDTQKKEQAGKCIITGNEAVSLAAVAAGCRLYVAYPMSPSTSILHTVAGWAKQTGMVVHQPEDEIAAIHVMIGAMNSGTRSMLATSGGGFALMTEGLTLSAMTETPAVMCVCSRPAPATGLPTWTEQGDLKFLVHAGHGDFPRVILAPRNPQEAFHFTTLAFNIAEKYQLPVFILMDKYLSESSVTVDSFDTQCSIERGKIMTQAQLRRSKKEYRRYAFVPDGVSPRALAGSEGGIHLANSDEHDEYGYAIEGWHEPIREKMVEKRARKLVEASRELPKPKLYGSKRARLTLLGWGSTYGPVMEALRHVSDVNYVHVPTVWPIDGAAIRNIVKGARTLVSIENNYSGQFARLLRAEIGIVPDIELLKYDGRQFWPEELVDKVQNLILNL